jgi:hypothetical protein
MMAMFEADREEIMACQEAMKACLEETNKQTPEEMKSVVVHEEIPKEHAAVKPVRGLMKWHRGRHIAAGSRSQPE